MKTATKKKTKKTTKKKGEVGKDLKLYGQPLDYTFLMGAYMAINAVPGTVILVDWPDCITGKVEHIFGKHDWSSTLLECTGLNRVECSFTDARNTVLCREKAVEKNMTVLAERKDCCCPDSQAAAEVAVTRISEKDLRARGLGDLMIGDLNHDGWLDTTDMALYMEGIDPVSVQPAMKRTTDTSR